MKHILSLGEAMCCFSGPKIIFRRHCGKLACHNLTNNAEFVRICTKKLSSFTNSCTKSGKFWKKLSFFSNFCFFCHFGQNSAHNFVVLLFLLFLLFKISIKAFLYVKKYGDSEKVGHSGSKMTSAHSCFFCFWSSLIMTHQSDWEKIRLGNSWWSTD